MNEQMLSFFFFLFLFFFFLYFLLAKQQVQFLVDTGSAHAKAKREMGGGEVMLKKSSGG
ncbi:hypothetical protein ACSS6W_002310 [Trichoderma asperelloides]